jgi:hypothetical protein
MSDVAEKTAVTPAGKPATEREMAELKPFSSAVVKVVLTELPPVTLRDAVVGDSVNVGVGIVTETANFAVWPPPVAVIVREYRPGTAEGLAVTFKADEPEPGDPMVADANAAVTPIGAPATDNVTADFRDALAVVVTLVCALLPTSKVRTVDDALSEMEGVTGLGPSVQWFTNRFASTEPKPDAGS